MKDQYIPASFVKGVRGTDAILFDGKPQIAFIGRSNVGKSSLINSILGKELARSSSQPGKTVNIDLFLVDNKIYFVDLPGYGFAKTSRDRLDHFRKMIAWYLFSSGVKHELVVLIIDAVVGITSYDKESIDLFIRHQIPFIIVANKIDKLKNAERPQKLQEIHRESQGIRVFPFSSSTLEGRQELLREIFRG